MDFTKALDVKAKDVEKPPVAPVGHYTFKVTKPAAMGDIDAAHFKAKTVSFPCQAIEAHEDVDADELKACGGVKGVNLRVQFLFNEGPEPEDQANAEKTLWNMTQFLTVHLGQDEDQTLKELMDGVVNLQFVGQVNHRVPDKMNPENKFAEIGRTAPVV